MSLPPLLDTPMYKTLFLNDLRFSAEDFTTIRCSNDACVLYELRKNQSSIDFILCIDHVVDKNEIYLLLNKVSVPSTANALNIRGRTLKCSNIMQGTIVSESIIITNASHIIQKLAFRLDHGKTETESNTFAFFQYSNIKESS